MSDVYAWRDPFVEVAEARAAQQLAQRERDELRAMRSFDVKPWLGDAFAGYLRDVIKQMAAREASRDLYDQLRDGLRSYHDAEREIERRVSQMDALADAVTFQIAKRCSMTLTPKLGSYTATLEIKSIGPIDATYEIDFRAIEMRSHRR